MIGAFVPACGLGHAQSIRHEGMQGTIALHGDREAAREDAERRIASQCGGPYTIVREDRLPIGGDRLANEPEANRIYEYHLTYECVTPSTTTASAASASADG